MTVPETLKPVVCEKGCVSVAVADKIRLILSNSGDATLGWPQGRVCPLHSILQPYLETQYREAHYMLGSRVGNMTP
jgi:hypothetical protein